MAITSVSYGQETTATKRYGTAITEGPPMASRDGVRFKRWNEAFLRPGIERPDTWNYGHQYIAWHAVNRPVTWESEHDLAAQPVRLRAERRRSVCFPILGVVPVSSLGSPQQTLSCKRD